MSTVWMFMYEDSYYHNYEFKPFKSEKDAAEYLLNHLSREIKKSSWEELQLDEDENDSKWYVRIPYTDSFGSRTWQIQETIVEGNEPDEDDVFFKAVWDRACIAETIQDWFGIHADKDVVEEVFDTLKNDRHLHEQLDELMTCMMASCIYKVINKERT